MPEKVYTKFFPFYDTFAIEDFGVAPPNRVVLFSGNPQQWRYPQNKSFTNMHTQGEIPQGEMWIAKSMKVILWVEYPITPTQAFAIQQNIRTFLYGMSAQIRIEGINEFRNVPLELVVQSEYALRTYTPTPSTPAPQWVWYNYEQAEHWGGHRTGSHWPFGNLPQPREPNESVGAYRARLKAGRPPLVPLILKPQQEFSVVFEQTDQFPIWNADADVEVRLKVLLEGSLTTDIDIATGTPTDKALGAPARLLQTQITPSETMQDRLAGVSQF